MNYLLGPGKGIVHVRVYECGRKLDDRECKIGQIEIDGRQADCQLITAV